MATIINLKDSVGVLKKDSQDHGMKRTALLGPKKAASKLVEAHSQNLSVRTVSLEITVAKDLKEYRTTTANSSATRQPVTEDYRTAASFRMDAMDPGRQNGGRR